jgi:hypothetical protein
MTWTCGGRLVTAVARKPMPLPLPGQLPLRRTLQQFIEGSSTRWLQSPSQCVAPRHFAAAPQCKASRRCAGAGMDRHFNGIFTEVVENGAGVCRWFDARPRAIALSPAAPNNQWCCSPSESTIVAGTPAEVQPLGVTATLAAGRERVEHVSSIPGGQTQLSPVSTMR